MMTIAGVTATIIIAGIIIAGITITVAIMATMALAGDVSAAAAKKLAVVKRSVAERVKRAGDGSTGTMTGIVITIIIATTTMAHTCDKAG